VLQAKLLYIMDVDSVIILLHSCKEDNEDLSWAYTIQFIINTTLLQLNLNAIICFSIISSLFYLNQAMIQTKMIMNFIEQAFQAQLALMPSNIWKVDSELSQNPFLGYKSFHTADKAHCSPFSCQPEKIGDTLNQVCKAGTSLCTTTK